MRNLRTEIGSSILFITHDLAVAAQIADRVVVMYAGQILEDANAIEIFENPLHPYTEGLIRSFPRMYKHEGKMEAIPGETPDLSIAPKGCPFEPRCNYRFGNCATEQPELKTVKTGHSVACFLRHSDSQ